MSLEFKEPAERKFMEILARYPKRDAALLPVLWLAQDEFGVLTDDVRDFVARKLDVSRARVESVVSFYTLYRTKKLGTHHFQVCKNISCYLRGSSRLIDVLEKELGWKPNEPAEGEKFSFTTVECLAACGGAPALQVNGDYHENMDAEKLRSLIGKLKANGKDRH